MVKYITYLNIFNMDIKMAKHEHRSGMIDNRMVKDNHQEGIERVKQRKSEYNPKDCEGHHGAMGNGWRHDRRDGDHFSRPDGSLTPRKA